jgi:hypothetical protein
MENIKMMALFVIVAFIGIGFAVPAMPLITDVSAQENMTGNTTGNYTDTDGDAGNISSLSLTP